MFDCRAPRIAFLVGARVALRMSKPASTMTALWRCNSASCVPTVEAAMAAGPPHRKPPTLILENAFDPDPSCKHTMRWAAEHEIDSPRVFQIGILD